MAKGRKKSSKKPGKNVRRAKSPPGSPGLMKRAVAHHQEGRLQDAENLCRRILQSHPGHLDANNLLGVIAYQAGHFETAVEFLKKAVQMAPRNASFHSNLGIVFQEQGRLEEGAACYGRALDLDPDSELAHGNLGNLLLKQGRPAESAASFERALALNPDAAVTRHKFGNALFEQGRLDEAAEEYERALSIMPGLAGAHNDLGNIFQERRRFGEAAERYEKAVSIAPDFLEARINLGNALQEQGKLDEAIVSLERAAAIDPDSENAHNNLGVTLLKLGRVDEAAASYERALARRPHQKTFEYNLAIALLLQGDLRAGFRHFESRWDTKELENGRRDFSQPMWDASPLGGKTILLHAEQGYGDTFQFVRYAGPVAERGGRVILECPAGCKKLMEALPGIGAVFEKGEALPGFDVHAPLMSLPRILGTTLDTIPGGVPYLVSPENYPVPDRLSADEGKLKVGLVWAGNPEHTNDRNRSIPLEKFAPLLDTGKVRFFSLQAGEKSGDIRSLGYQDRLEDLSGMLTDFSAAAAAMAHLDLLISVDTAPVHLAGAMGKSVWTLIPFAPDWRWMLERSDSPWYPAMKLFRQKKIGDWESVLAGVKENLDRMTF